MTIKYSCYLNPDRTKSSSVLSPKLREDPKHLVKTGAYREFVEMKLCFAALV